VTYALNHNELLAGSYKGRKNKPEKRAVYMGFRDDKFAFFIDGVNGIYMVV
jgi:hypothetical protein